MIQRPIGSGPIRIRVCSGFSPEGRRQYGERFLAAFDRYWPRSTELQVYVEEPTPMPRDAERSLWSIPGATEFRARWAADPKVNGREAQPCWKEREVSRGYSFKTDAYKFFKQILIPEAAAVGLEPGDVLVWLDADVETTAAVPEGFVDQLLGDADVAYLGRTGSHSEIGFWAVRIGDQQDRVRHFLHAIAEQYRSGRFLDLPEWHSAFVWDHVRRSMEVPLCERNLVRPGLRGHVWPYTALASYTRHDKGARKPR
jgi:hypothetical protein